MLLLLPALRLLRALFRRRLGLRLSLLRHCCPPSHLVMAMSEQCPRESQALHSDYYSAAKKSATPLNEACMRARRHKLLCSQRASARALQRQSLSTRGKCTAVLRRSEKIPIPSMFLHGRSFPVEACLACARHAHVHPNRTDNAARSTSIKHVEKIFARALARGALAVVDSDRNRANRSKVIRWHAHRAPKFSVRTNVAHDDLR